MNPPFVLVNPPSPPGAVINREGFGGLGVLTPGRQGFVYAPQRLAEAASFLRTQGQPVVGLDYVASERAAKRAWRRCENIPGVIVHVSPTSLLSDLNAARLFQRAAGGRPCVLTGVGLNEHRDAIDDDCPGVIIDSGPTGYGAAFRLLGMEGDPAIPDAWPDASWDTFPLGRKGRLPIYHARGCTHSCDYCPYVIPTGREVWSRTPERTAREFFDQVRRHRPRRVVFRDPAFGIQRASCLQLLELLGKGDKRSRAPFEVESRPELLDAEFLTALLNAGCVEVKVGIESLEEDVLLATRRVTDRAAAQRYVEAVEALTKTAADLRILVRPFVMTGMPGATPRGETRTRRQAELLGDPVVKRVQYPQAAPAR